MKIVVTGALGHIGSALIRVLPNQFVGAEIVMIDNMATLRYASLFGLPAHGRYRFIEADVRHADLRPLFKDAYAAVHLAATTDAAGSVNSPAKVAGACAEAGTRLIHLSSTSIYGTQAETVSEDCPAEDLKPQTPYAESKLKEEKLLRSLHNSGLQAVICRFGTIFGSSPGMRFHTAVNKFCWQAVMRQPLTIWRTAYDQKRPYLELGDAVRAIAHILERDLFDGTIYNVLTLNATVRDLVETIRRFLPELSLSFVDSPIMNQLSYEVSAQRFIDRGFAFTGDLQRGIGETVALLETANRG
jgi:UDP-glucose 4-epimerase